MKALAGVLCLAVVAVVAVGQEMADYGEQGREVAMHSIRRPYIRGHGGIRHWTYGGSTVATDEFLRLTPDARGKSGRLWNTVKNHMLDWETEVEFRITGDGRLGADGLATWYVEKSDVEGPVFGSMDKWKGLLVAVDTFDNDMRHDNPYIAVILNDGTKSFNADDDGKSIQVGGCYAAVRSGTGDARSNFLRVKYLGSQKKLTVSIDTQGDGEYTQCYEGTVDLPRGYFLGVTAATGDLTDNHDVLTLVTNDLTKPDARAPLFEEPPVARPVEPPKETDKAIQELLEKVAKLKGETVAPPQQPPQQPGGVQPPPQQPPQPAAGTQQQQEAFKQAPHSVDIPTPPAQQPPQPPHQQHSGQQQQMPPPVQPPQQQVPVVQQQAQDVTPMIRKLQEQNVVLMEIVTKLLTTTPTVDTVRKENAATTENIRVMLNEFKASVVRDVSQQTRDTSRANDNAVGNLRSNLDTIARDVNTMHDRLGKMNEKTLQTITARTSYGFWIFLMIFQVLFIVTFFIWKKMRDDASKKFI